LVGFEQQSPHQICAEKECLQRADHEHEEYLGQAGDDPIREFCEIDELDVRVLEESLGRLRG
jgi:hypothetical protein